MMKKIVLLILLLSSFSFGQEHYLGFSGGYSYSSANVLSGTSGKLEPKHLYFGEFNYQYHAEKWLFFNIGIRYDRKGFGINEEYVLRDDNDALTNSDTLGNYSYDFHKVGVPIKIGFKLGGKVFFQFGLGVIPSYALISEANWNLTYQGNEIESTSIGSWTNIKNFELPWIGEIGFGAYLNEHILLNFMAGYTQSLTKHLMPVRSLVNNDLITDYRTVRFKGIHASIGLYFNLHKKKKKIQKYSPSSN